MSVTIEKILKSAKVLEEGRPLRKQNGNVKKLKGMFADVGKKLKKQKKTSVDLVREIRDIR